MILEKDVASNEFLVQLHELQHKLNFMRTQQFHDAKSVEDVHDVIENLKMKAMEKIRVWLLLKIEMFKKPFINYQVTHGALLKNRYFILFYEWMKMKKNDDIIYNLYVKIVYLKGSPIK